MNTAIKLIRNKIELLKLAEELGNVSHAKLFGYNRDSLELVPLSGHIVKLFP